LAPLVVIIGFFCHSDGNHKNKRRYERNHESNSECLDYLRKSDYEEEEVEKELELIEKHQGNKVEKRVFCVVHGVLWISQLLLYRLLKYNMAELHFE
jgi:hypothetical protein